MAEEMTRWFGRNCFWIFWKFPIGIIETEFGVCKQEGIYQLNHLLFKLNMKNDPQKFKEKVAQQIIDYYKKGEIKEANDSLEKWKSLIGEKAYNYLYKRINN